MLISIITKGIATGNWRDLIIGLLLAITSSLIALSVHEAAHGLAAYMMGDKTAYNLGRVTLNPAKHLDLMGTLMMLVFGFGWAKPVPINARNFRKPKWGMALTGIAGPLSNMILGSLGAMAAGVIVYLDTDIFPNYAPQVFEFSFYEALFFVVLNFTGFFGIINFVYAFFNLIPLPPFDGSRFFFVFLPPKWYFGIMKYERYIMIGLLVLLMFSSRIFGFSPFSELANLAFSVLEEGTEVVLKLIRNLIITIIG